MGPPNENKPSKWDSTRIITVKCLLVLFHKLPDGLKLYLRSFKEQEPELYELKSLVEKGTIAVDIGANKGAYTYALSRIVGKKGLVLAFEPIAELADYLSRACSQLRLPVQIEQCCLSDKEGFADLFIPIEDNELQTGLASLAKTENGHSDIRKVETKKLDDLLKDRDRRVSFIKCDVEGHEIAVFHGALEILKSDRPNLLVEIEQRHFEEPLEKHFDFFQEQGYKPFFLDFSNGTKKVIAVDYDLLSHFSLNDSEKIINYVYNFIFLPQEFYNIVNSKRVNG